MSYKNESSKGKFQKLFFILLAIVITGCGKQSEDAGQAQVTTGSIIVGDLGWREINTSSSSVMKENAKAVADVDLPVMGSRCTGFLVANNVLMTNQHCIPTASHARGVTVTFDHVKGVSKSAQKRFKCDKFIGNDSKLDFALLECEGNPGAEYGVVELSDDTASVKSNIYVVQQNCDYYSDRNCDWTKKYSTGQVTKVADEYSHNADTLGGSSGSPVFSSSSNKVVGIHHAGYGNNGMGRGYENYAVPMNKIVQHIHTYFPQVQLGQSSGGSTPTQPSGPKGNDTMEGATKLSGSKRVRGSVSSSKDVDFFKFTAYSKVTATLTFSHSDGDLDMYLVDSNGNVVDKSESISNKEFFSKKVKAGTYYVLVKGYKGATGKYYLDID
ncbi:PPC domain-containing protein [Bacteriovoracaceae bacterium]|nr:PPC domain-containing protein [Bacteriovoracaceae bacterium]